jgi:hypothetical protein
MVGEAIDILTATGYAELAAQLAEELQTLQKSRIQDVRPCCNQGFGTRCSRSRSWRGAVGRTGKQVDELLQVAFLVL